MAPVLKESANPRNHDLQNLNHEHWKTYEKKNTVSVRCCWWDSWWRVEAGDGARGWTFLSKTHAGHGKKHLCRIVKVFWDQVVTTTFLYTQNTSHAVSLRYIRCLCWEKNMDLSILWSKIASLLPNCSHKISTVHGSANIPGSHGYHNKIPWKFSRPFLTTVPKFGMIKFLKSDSQFWWKPSFLLMVFLDF